MWICMNDGFVSIVEDYSDKNMVYVRARKKEHLIAFIGQSSQKIDIIETAERDYTFRIHVQKSFAAFRVAEKILNIDYGNFKNSVHDMELKRGYHLVWRDMFYSLDDRADQLDMYKGYAERKFPK